MERATFTSGEFLLLSLALNNALTGIFKNGVPGKSKEELHLLMMKVHNLGNEAHERGDHSVKTFHLHDEQSAEEAAKESWTKRL